jgi:FAD/FMN-containing dehydrogenase
LYIICIYFCTPYRYLFPSIQSFNHDECDPEYGFVECITLQAVAIDQEKGTKKMEKQPLESSAELITKLPGKVFFPTDEGYNTARRGWNLTDDKHPGVIVFAENALDVIEAITYANKHALPIAIQATGHRETGKAEGALLINTSRMKNVRVDPQAQTAWVEAGAKWSEVLMQAQAHGLAPLLGSSTDVGAVGYSLSGGMGWLCRKFGMAVDSILRLEVVTLDGEFRRASLDENSDLFWALRGGGGGFGVVTGMEIRVFPVSTVYAGNLFYPPHLAKEVYQRYRQWIQDMPEEMTCSIVSFNFPPLPELPPALSGQSFVLVRGCYTGAVENGEKLLDFWRKWQPPALDDFKARPFTEADMISMDPVDPMPALLSGEWLTDLTEEASEILIRHTLPPQGLLPEGGPPAFVFSEVRLAGGTIARVDPDSNAYSHRDEKFLWYSVALPMDMRLGEQIDQRLHEMRAALAPWLTGKVYLNFLEGDEMCQRTRAGYTEMAFRRLQALKAQFDPDSRIISSFNIPPEA